jgi:hypothetical protein
MSLGAFRLNTFGKSASDAGWLMYNTGARASNITPGGFEVDSSGDIYILDMYSSQLAKINSSGVIQWQNYISSPGTTTGKSDGGQLCLSASGQYLYCQLKESSTSVSLCQFLTSTGGLNTKQITSVAAGSTIYAGSVAVSAASTYAIYGLTVSGVNRWHYKRYNGGDGALGTSASTLYHLASGATSVNDVRFSHDVPYGTASTMSFAYQNYVGQFAPATPTMGQTRSFSGGFDSVIAGRTTQSTFLTRNNIIARWTGAFASKAWEKTHTVGGIGGDHYYQQGAIADASDNIYSCYWQASTSKIIIYKLNVSGALQWTKSISLNSATEVDSMLLKLVGTTDLYLAFKYGTISDGGMAILKIPTDGTLTSAFDNGFILATETGSVSDTTLFTLSTNTPASSLVTTGTTGSAFTVANTTLPSYTKRSI